MKPRDNVDLYWTGNTGGNSGDITQLIESTVKVVAVDQAANDDRASEASVAQTVTVEGTPQQVRRLAQAAATGGLALSLVGIGDTTTVSVVEVDNRRLLGIEASAPILQAQADRVCTVRTRKGSEMVEIPVPCTNRARPYRVLRLPRLGWQLRSPATGGGSDPRLLPVIHISFTQQPFDSCNKMRNTPICIKDRAKRPVLRRIERQ